MNGNHKKRSPRRRQTILVWTYAQAQNAVPYLASVMRSLREHALEARRHYLAARRLARRPGRPDRAALIAHDELVRQARHAEQRFDDALAELGILDIRCLDPVRGLALIPFVHDDHLAWFVYDLFDSNPLLFWQLEGDPQDTRRPIAEVLEGPTQTTLVA